MKKNKLTPLAVGRALVKALDTRALEHDELVKKLSVTRGKKYQAGAKSLLISYGDVPGQALHIDMEYPLVQANLLMTDSKTTEVYPVQELLEVPNWEETGMPIDLFMDLLQKRVRTQLSGPDRRELTSIFQKKRGLTESIKKFGWLLASQQDMKAARTRLEGRLEEVVHMEWKDVKEAGYFSFPGSVVHAAPPVRVRKRRKAADDEEEDLDDIMRMLLFGAYHGEGDKPYNKVTQESAASLFTGILDVVFQDKKLNQRMKVFLTSILVGIVGEDPEGAEMTLFTAGPEGTFFNDKPKQKRDGTYSHLNVDPSGKKQKYLNSDIGLGQLVSYVIGAEVNDLVHAAAESKTLSGFRGNILKDVPGSEEEAEGKVCQYDPVFSVEKYWPGG